MILAITLSAVVGIVGAFVIYLLGHEHGYKLRDFHARNERKWI